MKNIESWGPGVIENIKSATFIKVFERTVARRPEQEVPDDEEYRETWRKAFAQKEADIVDFLGNLDLIERTIGLQVLGHLLVLFGQPCSGDLQRSILWALAPTNDPLIDRYQPERLRELQHLASALQSIPVTQAEACTVPGPDAGLAELLYCTLNTGDGSGATCLPGGYPRPAWCDLDEEEQARWGYLAQGIGHALEDAASGPPYLDALAQTWGGLLGQRRSSIERPLAERSIVEGVCHQEHRRMLAKGGPEYIRAEAFRLGYPFDTPAAEDSVLRWGESSAACKYCLCSNTQPCGLPGCPHCWEWKMSEHLGVGDVGWMAGRDALDPEMFMFSPVVRQSGWVPSQHAPQAALAVLHDWMLYLATDDGVEDQRTVQTLHSLAVRMRQLGMDELAEIVDRRAEDIAYYVTQGEESGHS